MTKKLDVSASSTDAVLQTVAWALKAGLKPVPLHPNSKAAISRDYAQAGYKPPPLEFWKNNDCGVGIATQDGIYDTDLDCEEAIRYGKIFLPLTTARWGRASKPNSHYLYHSESGTPKFALTDPVNHSTIVELRSEGHQTVLPGNIHPDSKELITWSEHAFPEIITINIEQYIRSIKKIGIATLIERHVFAPGFKNNPSLHLAGMFFYLDWSHDEAWEVVDAVLQHIGDRDKTRAISFRRTFEKGASGMKITGASRLRKELHNEPVVDRLLEWAGDDTASSLHEYNETYAVVSLEGKFRIVNTGGAAGAPPVFYQKDDFLNLTATDYAPVSKKENRPVSKGKLWLANPRRRQYDNALFLPGVEDPPGVLNLWTGWAVQPKPGSCAAFLELCDLVCGRDSYWTLNWLAHILRKPMEKPLTALVLIGRQGIGKSLLLAYFGRILGSPGYTVITNEEHVHGRFNFHLGNTLLLHSEEATYGGDRRHRGILKSLITDRFHMYEMKGIDARQTENFIRLVITSNSIEAAPIEPGDRRYSIIDSPAFKIEDDLVTRVVAEMNGDGPAALHHYLTHEHDYDETLVKLPVRSAASLSMINIHLQPVESWWKETLEAGQLLPDYLTWAQRPDKADWPDTVSAPALYLSFVMDMKNRRGNVPSREIFAATLLQMLGRRALSKKQVWFNNPQLDDFPPEAKRLSDRQQSITSFPDLISARRAFEIHIGQTIEWPTPPATDEGPPEDTDPFSF